MWILKLDNLCGTEGVSFLSNVLGDLFVFDHIEEALPNCWKRKIYRVMCSVIDDQFLNFLGISMSA